MAKSRRTEKQKFQRDYEAFLRSEIEEEDRQQREEDATEEAYYRWYLQKEEEDYIEKLFEEAARRRVEMSREAYNDWLSDHPNSDLLTDFLDSSYDCADDYPVCDYYWEM